MRGAFVGAAALYALAAVLLAASLPAQVPIRFAADLTADRWTSRGMLVLLVCTLGALVIGVFAAVAARLDRLRTDLLQLGAVTLLFLVTELVLVYRDHTGGVAADLPTPAAEAAFLQATQAGVALTPWTLVVVAGYLGYVVGWLGWVGARRQPARSGPRHDRVPRSTADSSR